MLSRLYVKEFGEYKIMSANLHVLYVHGEEYLKHAEDNVGVPLGVLSESAMEHYNKVA